MTTHPGDGLFLDGMAATPSQSGLKLSTRSEAEYRARVKPKLESDRWIVSNYRFTEHPALHVAEAELTRLQAVAPKQAFRIYRVKSRLQQTGNYPKILNALREMVSEFGMEIDHENLLSCQIVALDNARAVLATVESTTPAHDLITREE